MGEVKEPRISVIIPTYNRAHLLGETLDSVLNQTYKNWECIIIDDGSTDHTLELMKEYLKDSRFSFIQRPEDKRKGACTCRNIGISNASGDYLQFLDSDDILASNKFESQLKSLNNSGAGYLAICKWGSIKPMWKKPRLYLGLPTYLNTSKPEKLLKIFGRHTKYLPPHTYLIPAPILLKAGNWNEDLYINQDGEFFTRIILNSEGIKFCDDTYVLYRTGAGDRISNRRNSAKGISSFITSWRLVAQHIEEKTGIKEHLYVKQAKADLYQRLKKEKSSILDSESEFFRNRTSYFYYQLLKFYSRTWDKLFIKQHSL